MKRPYATLLSVILVIIFLAGLTVLFLRQPLVNSLRVGAGIPDLDLTKLTIQTSSDLVDITVLENPVLGSMKNYVQIFNIKEVCGASISTKERCSVGNKHPFGTH